MDIKNFQGQQTGGNQRNIDKDGVFLTENYGGLNTESSSMNMPLTDSPALMNVEVTTSGKLKKRRGSLLITSVTDTVDQHIPVKLLDGSIVNVLLLNDSIRVVTDSYGSPTTLYTASNVLPTTTTYKNTSVTTVVEGDFTYIYFVRRGTPPVMLAMYQAYATNSGTTVTIPNYYSGVYRDTSKVTNCAFRDTTGTWRAYSSINASTGAGTLSTTPTSGVGIHVMFHWYWFAENMWRDKGHIEDNLVRTHSNRATDTRQELSSKMKQHLLASKTISERDKSGEYNGTTRTIRPSAVAINAVSSDNPLNVVPSYYTANPVPQQAATVCSSRYWFTGGQYVTPGAYSSVSGNSPSLDPTWLYLSGETHLQWGGVYYTDAAYSVPYIPQGTVVFSAVPIPFRGGLGCYRQELLVRTNNALYTVQTGAPAFVTSPNLQCALSNVTSDVSGTYLNQVTDNVTYGWWLTFNNGYICGILGANLLVTDTSKHGNSWFGSGAQEGLYSGYGSNIKDGIWTCYWGLSRWMNYHTGAFASVVGTYQDRLVLSGFDSSPGTLAFSNVGTQDETVFSIGNTNGALKNRSFDITHTDPELSTSPVEISLDLDAGESIKCLLQWYDDLFVGTNKNIFRIHGGDNLAITPSNFFVSKVANVGSIINGMVLTDDGIVFLSDSGVYRIVLDVNTGAYKVDNIGLKIRPEIKACMNGTRFSNSVGRISYDNTNNVIYVLVGDEYNSSHPRRCFVYFADRDAWSEYSMFPGFMNARTVSSIDGRVFMGIKGLSGSTTYFGEFNIDSYYTDLNYTTTLQDDSDSGYDMDSPVATWARGSYISGQNAVLSFGGALKLNPVIDYNNSLTLSDGSNTGVAGTDFWRHKNNNVVVNGTTFWTGSETLTATLYQEESNPRVINVYSVSNEDYLSVASLDYTSNMLVQAKVDSGYDNASVVISLSYPTWWVSPAFTRNDIKDIKRMKHFYGIFENSLNAGNNTYTAPSWDALCSFNLSIMQNGTEGGQVIEDNLSADSVRDLTEQAPAWLDFYRVSLPIKGSFVSFQACVHSFDRGQWEMVGYQIETDTEGRTSRRAYNE